MSNFIKSNNDMYQSFFKSKKGLNKTIVLHIARENDEPAWMIDFRLAALACFQKKKMPTWGADLSQLDHHDLHYYVKPTEKQFDSWEQVPKTIKKTFDQLGVPEAEKKFLAGVGAQYDSGIVYNDLKPEWKAKGVVFLDMHQGLKQFPEQFKRYFATIVPPDDNKFAALNSAVWSGGSFVYIPKNVHVTLPLQAYFRIAQPTFGQFERTLIIAEPGSFVHYVEGCSAPVYRSSSLHSAVVELIALPGAHIRYTTIQNWSPNVYNLVTKRAVAYKDAKVEWVDGNFGSKVTMKYPSIILKEPGASGQIISVAVAKKGQHQDAGGKIIHCAPHTRSNIVSKSISSGGGRSSYRGLLKVIKNAHHVTAHVTCDALMLDDISRADTYPTVIVKEKQATVGHEASISKVSERQLFFLTSRGLTQTEARALIVNGFIDLFVQQLPMEYAVEINRLIALEMENSIG